MTRLDDQDRPFSYNSWCTKTKIIIMCLLCTTIYFYTYVEVSKHTYQIQSMIEETWRDIQNWNSSVREWIFQVSNADTALHHNACETDVVRKHMAQSSNETIIERESFTGIEKLDIPLLTLFTTWPTTEEKFLCHNNTVKNWRSFYPNIIPVLFSNETDLTMKVQRNGWKVLPIKKSTGGIPILKYMFLDTMKEVSSHFYGYSNGDILFTDMLIESLRTVLLSKSINRSHPLMIVGQRTNVESVTREEALTWENITNTASARGKLFTPYAEDFFITMENYPWKEIPDLVIGRRAYDNWLVLNSRKRKFTTIDITSTSYAVHQTTKAGNYEGHHHKNGSYNHNLLRKLYKHLRYEAGLTICTDKLTKTSTDGRIIVKDRKISKGCFPL